MASVADIQVAIWADPEFEALPNDAALLYLWSFSNPLINPAGLYRVSRSKLLDGRLTGAKLDAALEALADGRFVFYSTDAYLWVRSHARNFRSPGEKTIKSIEQTLRKVGHHPLVVAFIDEYRTRPSTKLHGLTARLDVLAEEGLAEPLEGPSKGLDISLSRAKSEGPSRPLVRGLGQGPGPGQGLEVELTVDAGERASARPKIKHDRKIVPEPTQVLAEEILDEFNRQAGTGIGAYTAKGQASDALSRILTALGNYPDITGDIAGRMIAHQLKDPYWAKGGGRARPGHVFGPGSVQGNLDAALNTGPGQPGGLSERDKFVEASQRQAAAREAREAARAAQQAAGLEAA